MPVISYERRVRVEPLVFSCNVTSLEVHGHAVRSPAKPDALWETYGSSVCDLNRHSCSDLQCTAAWVVYRHF